MKTEGIVSGDFIFVVDPTGHYIPKGATKERLMEAAGLIPIWFVDFAVSESDLTLKEYMTESYGFGPLFPMTGGTVNEDFTYNYPEDPKQYPLLHATTSGGQAMIQWQHGMVAFQEEPGSEWFMTRMD